VAEATRFTGVWIEMKRLVLLVWMLFLLSVTPAMAEERIAFSLPDIHGKVHTLSEYAGKWVVVNYWATSCGPCLKEIPELVAFHKQHQDRDIVLLGVDFEDIQLSWLKDFMDSVSMNYTVLRSDTSQETPFGTLMVLPTTFIVSPAGELMARQTGAVTAADLEAYIARKIHAGQMESPMTKHDSKIH
jgi:thiol-disulfide isomerase/thioredoxin